MSKPSLINHIINRKLLLTIIVILRINLWKSVDCFMRYRVHKYTLSRNFIHPFYKTFTIFCMSKPSPIIPIINRELPLTIVVTLKPKLWKSVDWFVSYRVHKLTYSHITFTQLSLSFSISKPFSINLMINSELFLTIIVILRINLWKSVDLFVSYRVHKHTLSRNFIHPFYKTFTIFCMSKSSPIIPIINRELPLTIVVILKPKLWKSVDWFVSYRVHKHSYSHITLTQLSLSFGMSKPFPINPIINRELPLTIVVILKKKLWKSVDWFVSYRVHKDAWARRLRTLISIFFFKKIFFF